MTRYLKYTLNLLLMLIAFQVFNMNTAECAASADDGSITADHTISYVAEKCWEHTLVHFEHPGKSSHEHHQKGKVWKKFFPEKVSINIPAMLTGWLPAEEPLQHYAVVAGYQFLYFRIINPPPPKLFA